MGFTPLDTLVKGTVPQNLVSIAWFLFVGWLTMKRPNLRCESTSDTSFKDHDHLATGLFFVFLIATTTSQSNER